MLCCRRSAEKKKDVMDEDILALVSDEVHQPEKLWDVLDLQVGSHPIACFEACMQAFCDTNLHGDCCLLHSHRVC